MRVHVTMLSPQLQRSVRKTNRCDSCELKEKWVQDLLSHFSWCAPWFLEGYGDLTPHTQEERFLAIIFIPFACAVTGHCLTWFARWIIEKQGAKYRKTTFESHSELTPEDLKVMDLDGGTFSGAIGAIGGCRSSC